MTPLLASVLAGWARGGRDAQGCVIGAAISIIIDEEVGVEIFGREGRHAILTLYGARNIQRTGELTRFLLELKDSEGEETFDSVSVNIRGYQEVVRQA
jgi:hypothetical protein